MTSASSTPPSAHPGFPSFTHRETLSIVFGVMVSMLLAALDQTIVATALPIIGTDLRDIEHLPFVVSVYLLTATAVTPLYGKASDIYGRRVVLMIGITIFVIGSVICALAPNMLTLIVARGIQGIGGGGLISLAQTILADIMAPKERARYQVYIAMVFVVASLAGPLLGGFIAEHLHWSLIFWINLPLGLAAFGMTFTVLKKLPRHRAQHRLDILGAVVMSAATVTFMLGLNWGGIRYPWTSAPILGLFAVSFVLWVLFVLRLRSAAEPLIPGRVFANKVVTAATASALCAMGASIGLTIYMPVYLQAIHGLSASAAGVSMIPLMVGTVVGATMAGRSMMYFKHYKRVPLVGLLVSVLALGGLAFGVRTLPLWAVEVLFGLTSIGIGTVLPTSLVSIQNAVMPSEMGTATAASNFFRQLGGALFVAIMGAIVLAGLPEGTVGSGSLENLRLAGSPEQLGPTFARVFAAGMIGLFLAWLGILAMEERPLRGRVSEAMEEALGG